MTHDNKGNLLIPNPIYRAKVKWQNNRKIKLTRHEAMTVSAMLENYRLSLRGEAYEQEQVLKAENWIDVQLFGKIKVNGEWVKP